jgi:hypothetical protein
MDRRQLLVGMTALGLARNLSLPDLLTAQSIETGDSLLPTSATTSDRERDGLRGPVRMSVAESETRFGKTGATQEYDLDGRLLASRSTYPGSEWENTRTYDADGRVLRTTKNLAVPATCRPMPTMKEGDSSASLIVTVPAPTFTTTAKVERLRRKPFPCAPEICTKRSALV